jgi:hypothetical protein
MEGIAQLHFFALDSDFSQGAYDPTGYVALGETKPGV